MTIPFYTTPETQRLTDRARKLGMGGVVRRGGSKFWYVWGGNRIAMGKTIADAIDHLTEIRHLLFAKPQTAFMTGEANDHPAGPPGGNPGGAAQSP